MGRRSLKWFLIGAAVVVAAVTIGPFVYINFIRDDPPERLTLESRDEASDGTDTTAASDDTAVSDTSADSVDGTWNVTEGSEAGYRAKEILFSQDAEAVGRTSDVTGSFEISGTTVSTGSFTVDMTTIESDESRRDGQFHGRIMDTATYPTATFELTEPIELGTLPADGEQITVTANGNLTLRGVTNEVSVELEARRNGDNIEVAGSIPINFDDYEIPDASGGPASVGREGEVEFLLVFARA